MKKEEFAKEMERKIDKEFKMTPEICEFCKKDIERGKIRCKECNEIWNNGVKVGQQIFAGTLKDILNQLNKLAGKVWNEIRKMTKETIKERYKRIEETSYSELSSHDQITKAYLERQKRATEAKASDGQMEY